MKVFIDCDNTLTDFTKWVELYDDRHYKTEDNVVVSEFTGAYRCTRVLDSRLLESAKSDKDTTVLAYVPSIDIIEKYNVDEIEGKHVPSELIYKTLVKNREMWMKSHGITRYAIVTSLEDLVKYSTSDALLISARGNLCRKWREYGKGSSIEKIDPLSLNQHKGW